MLPKIKYIFLTHSRIEVHQNNNSALMEHFKEKNWYVFSAQVLLFHKNVFENKRCIKFYQII